MTKTRVPFLVLLFLTALSLFSCASTAAVKEQNTDVPQYLSVEELCPPEFEWTELEPGFFQTTFKIKSLGIKYKCVKIDLKNPALKIRPGIATSKNGARVNKFAHKQKPVLSVNTTPFDVKNYENIVGIVKTEGQILSKAAGSYCALALKNTPEGYQAEILNKQTDAAIEQFDSAFGGFFQILHNGQINYDFTVTRRSRSGCGISSDKSELYILVSNSGIELRDQNGLTYPECALILKAMGCTEGMQFDGGHSTGLSIYNRQVIRPIIQRKVPAVIEFFTN